MSYKMAFLVRVFTLSLYSICIPYINMIYIYIYICYMCIHCSYKVFYSPYMGTPDISCDMVVCNPALLMAVKETK